MGSIPRTGWNFLGFCKAKIQKLSSPASGVPKPGPCGVPPLPLENYLWKWGAPKSSLPAPKDSPCPKVSPDQNPPPPSRDENRPREIIGPRKPNRVSFVIVIVCYSKTPFYKWLFVLIKNMLLLFLLPTSTHVGNRLSLLFIVIFSYLVWYYKW